MNKPTTDAYFLAPSNPIATDDELAAEEQALRIFARPDLRDAVKRIGFLWRLGYGDNVSEQALSLFDSAMEENAFNYLLKAVASDGNYPRPVRGFMPAHKWFGRAIPGARMGGDNPDNCYRLIGIYPGARYELRGWPVGKAPASVTFTLTENYGTSKTIQTADYDGLRKEADGSFTLVIDGDPPGNRGNHLRSGPTVKFLFIRDSMQDWAEETPLALTIKRIDAPDSPPLSDTQIAERAINAMVDEVPLYYWFTRLCSGRPNNTASKPEVSAALGGLVTQAGIQGRFTLDDDDAYIFTMSSAGASYFSLWAYDWWFRSIEYWNHTSGLTASMMTPDADGRFTAVLSLNDPGVHNWIDPVGLREVLILARWQGLPRQIVGAGPQFDFKGVKLKNLMASLPEGTVTITPAQRRHQLQQRAAAYARRLAET